MFDEKMSLEEAVKHYRSIGDSVVDAVRNKRLTGTMLADWLDEIRPLVEAQDQAAPSLGMMADLAKRLPQGCTVVHPCELMWLVVNPDGLMLAQGTSERFIDRFGYAARFAREELATRALVELSDSATPEVLGVLARDTLGVPPRTVIRSALTIARANAQACGDGGDGDSIRLVCDTLEELLRERAEMQDGMKT